MQGLINVSSLVLDNRCRLSLFQDIGKVLFCVAQSSSEAGFGESSWVVGLHRRHSESCLVDEINTERWIVDKVCSGHHPSFKCLAAAR
jgi:hypothetical protein